MSGAVKGKGVIMKIEIDREMTGLMQQIKDLNAQKAGLFCNRGNSIAEDIRFGIELSNVNSNLLQKYSILYDLIFKKIDTSLHDSIPIIEERANAPK